MRSRAIVGREYRLAQEYIHWDLLSLKGYRERRTLNDLFTQCKTTHKKL